MKTCRDCLIEKPIDNFPLSGGNGRRAARCRPCKQQYDRTYYAEKKDKLNSCRKVTRKVVTDNKRKLVWEYLLSHPCIKCGETDPIVLEFDHRDRTTKLYNISDMVSSHYGVDTLLKEITKCDVLCANCHRRRTAEQFGWFNL